MIAFWHFGHDGLECEENADRRARCGSEGFEGEELNAVAPRCLAGAPVDGCEITPMPQSPDSGVRA